MATAEHGRRFLLGQERQHARAKHVIRTPFTPPPLGSMDLPTRDDPKQGLKPWNLPANIVAPAVLFLGVLHHTLSIASPRSFYQPRFRFFLSRITPGVCMLMVEQVSRVRPLLEPYLRHPGALQWNEWSYYRQNGNEWEELESDNGRLFVSYLRIVVQPALEAAMPNRHVALHMTTNGGCVYDWCDDWDLLQPTQPLLHTEYAPDKHPQELVAFLRILTACRGFFYYYSGPSPAARRDMWNSLWSDEGEKQRTLETNRQRLVHHLVTLPGVLIDWKKEPTVPWKGQQFFHGTSYKELQCDSSGDQYDECRLNWEAGANAFTTPYFSKAINYSKGVRVYAFQLSVAGNALQMLDLRTDYEQIPACQAELDPFHFIESLAGIERGGSDRRRKAELLWELFRETEIDGAIMNSDIEWIWFKAANVLQWVRPEIPGSLVQQLYDKPLHVEVAKPQKGWLDTFVQNHALVHQSNVDLSTIMFARFALEENLRDSYSPQFLATTIQEYNSQWIPTQIHGAVNQTIQIYECDYLDLMHALHPQSHFNNQILGTHVTEGSDNDLLPASIIKAEWRDKDAKLLLIRLPCGSKQLFPPICSNKAHKRTDTRHVAQPITAFATTASSSTPTVTAKAGVVTKKRKLEEHDTTSEHVSKRAEQEFQRRRSPSQQDTI